MSLRPIVAAVSILVLALLGPVACDDVAGEVRDTFDQFNSATNNRDAATAMAVMDPKNFERMDRMLEIARTGSREEISRLVPIDKLDVTTMRNRLTPEQLKSMDGRGYVRHAIQSGWWADDPDDPEMTLGKVTYKAPRALATLLEDGRSTPTRVEFVRVNEQWLIDLDGLNDWYNDLILKLCRMMNKSEDATVLWIETQDSGKVAKPELWNVPPVK